MWIQKIKTVLLLAGLSALFLVIGHAVGGTTGMTFAFILALIMNGVAYFYSDKIVLRMYGAVPLDQQEYGWLYGMVQELATTANIPMPKLWLINTPMANAFATGRNPQHASVAVTTGILSILDRHELRGVLAHELSHVYNRDILITTIAATLAAAIGYLASMVQQMAFWGSYNNNKDSNSRGNPIILFVIALIMPIAATIIQLAVSRSREYLADESGAHTCKDPLALASALEKLQNNIPNAHLNPNDVKKASTASLFIVNPFSASVLTGLFSTHPPMEARIARLRAMQDKMF